MSESTYDMAFFVLEYRDNLPIKGPPVLNSYSTPFSFSRFPASPHQSSNRPPSVQFDPLDPPFSAIMTAYSETLPRRRSSRNSLAALPPDGHPAGCRHGQQRKRRLQVWNLRPESRGIAGRYLHSQNAPAGKNACAAKMPHDKKQGFPVNDWKPLIKTGRSSRI